MLYAGFLARDALRTPGLDIKSKLSILRAQVDDLMNIHLCL